MYVLMKLPIYMGMIPEIRKFETGVSMGNLELFSPYHSGNRFITLDYTREENLLEIALFPKKVMATVLASSWA